MAGFTNGGLDGNSSSGKIDILLVKYNSSGAKQWTRQFGINYYDYGAGVSVDSSDNIYVTGYTSPFFITKTNNGKKDIFLVNYNSM